MSDDKQFLRDYQTLILGVWQDSAEEPKLVADPTGYAKQHGLPVEAGKTGVLDRSQPNGMLLGSQLVQAWNGDTHILRVPSTPPIDFDELNEEELQEVSAACSVIVIVL